MSETLTLIGPSGSTATVANKALSVRNVSDFELAVAAGNAFSWATLTYDPDAHDTIGAVENNSSTMDLYIHEIHIQSDAASQYIVFSGTGNTMAGTAAVVGTNLNRNSGYVAPATAFADETANVAQAAGYITSVGYKLYTGIVAADGNVVIPVDGAVILPNDHFIGVDFTTAATAGNVTIIGYFKAR